MFIKPPFNQSYTTSPGMLTKQKKIADSNQLANHTNQKHRLEKPQNPDIKTKPSYNSRLQTLDNTWP